MEGERGTYGAGTQDTVRSNVPTLSCCAVQPVIVFVGIQFS